jgi:hypothetical protein
MPPRPTYKLGDLGQVASIGAAEVAEGDSRYLARELLNGDTSNLPAADIFSLAMSVVELASGWHLPSSDEDYQRLRSGDLPWELLGHLQPSMQELLAAMAHPDASQRPTAQQVLEHPALSAASGASFSEAAGGVQKTGGVAAPLSSSAPGATDVSGTTPATTAQQQQQGQGASAIATLLTAIDQLTAPVLNRTSSRSSDAEASTVFSRSGAISCDSNGVAQHATSVLGLTPHAPTAAVGSEAGSAGSAASSNCPMKPAWSPDAEMPVRQLTTPWLQLRSVSTPGTDTELAAVAAGSGSSGGGLLGRGPPPAAGGPQGALAESGISLALASVSETPSAPSLVISRTTAVALQQELRALLGALQQSGAVLPPGLGGLGEGSTLAALLAGVPNEGAGKGHAAAAPAWSSNVKTPVGPGGAGGAGFGLMGPMTAARALLAAPSNEGAEFSPDFD